MSISGAVDETQYQNITLVIICSENTVKQNLIKCTKSPIEIV